MFGLLGVICLLGMSGPDLDGEDAIVQAHHQLQSLGFHEKLSLTALMLNAPTVQARRWSVGFRGKSGSVMLEIDAATGRLLFLQGMPAATDPQWTNHPADASTAKRANELIRLLGREKDARLDPIGSVQNGVYYAQFHKIVHGLTFFNINPTYADVIMFEPQTGAISYFRASPALPKTIDWTPIVSRERAHARISYWVTQRAIYKRKAPVFISPSQHIETELGYWKFAKEAEARLVWRDSRVMVTNGKRIDAGAYTIFVDALTGSLVVPDDPSMGENP